MSKSSDVEPRIVTSRSRYFHETGADPTVINELAGEIVELVRHPNLVTMDDKTRDICRRWDRFCHRLFHAYQDFALMEVEN